jgi:NADPH2:quinone reductase
MKAIQIDAFGDASVLKYQDVPEPELKAGEVLVRTLAAGVNPIDWKTCSGGGASAFIGELPFIPGWEFSGEVIAAGANVSGFDSGDKVYGFIRFPNRAGCYAQEIAAPVEQIAKLPAACNPIHAAGLGLAGLTAWQALFDKAALKAKQRVLILAAAGGVGHLAVQLAKWKGAYVIGTASQKNHAFLQALGCDEVLDYNTQALHELVKDVDVIIDGVGGETGISALACLAQQGIMITLPSVTKDAVIAAGESVGKQVLPIRVEPSASQLTQLAQLNADGDLKLDIAAIHPLEDTAKAFAEIASGHTRGKVILKVS